MLLYSVYIYSYNEFLKQSFKVKKKKILFCTFDFLFLSTVYDEHVIVIARMTYNLCHCVSVSAPVLLDTSGVVWKVVRFHIIWKKKKQFSRYMSSVFIQTSLGFSRNRQKCIYLILQGVQISFIVNIDSSLTFRFVPNHWLKITSGLL